MNGKLSFPLGSPQSQKVAGLGLEKGDLEVPESIFHLPRSTSRAACGRGCGRLAMRVARPSCRIVCLRVLERSPTGCPLPTRSPTPAQWSWMNTSGGKALCALRAG